MQSFDGSEKSVVDYESEILSPTIDPCQSRFQKPHRTHIIGMHFRRSHLAVPSTALSQEGGTEQ